MTSTEKMEQQEHPKETVEEKSREEEADQQQVNAQEEPTTESREESKLPEKQEQTETDQHSMEVEKAEFQDLDASPGNGEKELKLDLLMDLSLPVSIELGRTNLLIRDILNLQRGSIVEFEKLASEPVDILINGKKMAEGEVVVIEKHFGIRITNLIKTADRIKGLGKE